MVTSGQHASGAAPGGKIRATGCVYARIKFNFEVSELEPQSLKSKQESAPV